MSTKEYICPKCGGRYSEKQTDFHCSYCFAWYKTMDGWRTDTNFKVI